MIETEPCVICNRLFRPRNKRHKCCCEKCSRRYQARRQANKRARNHGIPYQPSPEWIKFQCEMIKDAKLKHCPQRLSSAYQGPTKDNSHTAHYIHPVEPDPDERVDHEIL